MLHRFIVISLLSALGVQADVLSSAQRFFGMGGQVPDYSEETSNGGDEVPATGLGQLPYSPADSDLGIQEVLAERQSREPIMFDFATSILRTDNAPSGSALTDRSSWVSASRMSLTWRPHIVQGWFADLGLGQELYRYDRTNALDFENLGLRAGIYKNLPDLDDTVFFARYEYQRLTYESLSEGDYNAQRIRAGLQKTLWAIPRHQLTGSLSGAYEWTARPAATERNEIAVDIAYRYSFTDKLYTLASARVSSYNFDQAGRDDLTTGAGLELIWQACPNFRAVASLFFEKNDSDTPVFLANASEYESWTGGLGINLQWSF